MNFKTEESPRRRNEDRLSRAQAISHVGDWEWEIATNAVKWSDELYRIYGFEPRSVQPDYGLVLAQMHPESKEEFLKGIDAALKEDRHFEMDYRFFRKDGSEAILHTIAEVIRDASGSPVSMLGTVQDITDRVEAERRLRESEDKFRSIFEQAIDGIMIADPVQKRNIEANRAICAMLGYTRDELITLGVEDMHPKEALPGILDLFERQLRGEISLGSDVPMLRKDGSVLYVDVNATHVTVGGKRCLMGIFRDITERKRAEKKLQKEKDFSTSIINGTAAIICGVAPDGATTFINPAGETITGYNAEELIGKNWWTVFYPGDEYRQVEQLFRDLNKGNVRDYEMTLTTRDGNKRTISWNSLNKFDKNGNIVEIIGFGNDITERKKLAEQLRQSQKMEAMGTLAGGVAHDFNNILSAIIGFGTMARKRIKEDDRTKEFIEEILAGAERAAELTHGLLAYSRKQTIKLIQLDLNDIVKKIHTMLVRIIGEDIELKSMLANTKLPVLVDPAQIDQVLLNLVTNARDAMPDGGYLVINTEEIYIDNRYAEANLIDSPGKYAVLTVSDTGTGMDQKTRENIFEPYFTTKEVGKGTGLGLAMVFGIVKQHGGNIKVYSEPGRGTSFRVYLPMVKTAVGERLETDKPVPSGSGETILIAEDDAQVRKIIRMFLHESGYVTIEAENGDEAVRKFKENMEKTSLLLLDVIMPLKNGREAYEEIRKIKPEAKAIFMSGYTDDIISRKGILADGLEFISKPISPYALMRKVREVLDRERLPG
jgi:PAS domain S-box-containing protein